MPLTCIEIILILHVLVIVYVNSEYTLTVFDISSLESKPIGTDHVNSCYKTLIKAVHVGTCTYVLYLS